MYDVNNNLGAIDAYVLGTNYEFINDGTLDGLSFNPGVGGGGPGFGFGGHVGYHSKDIKVAPSQRIYP